MKRCHVGTCFIQQSRKLIHVPNLGPKEEEVAGNAGLSPVLLGRPPQRDGRCM
jgi:hypothetical protein